MNMSEQIANSSKNDPPFELCERTFAFALRIVALCEAMDEKPGVRWALSKQLLRSGTSVGANVEEAQGGQSRADFISKYSIARKELRETNSWLRLLKAGNLASASQIDPPLNECEQLTKILTAIIIKVRNTM